MYHFSFIEHISLINEKTRLELKIKLKKIPNQYAVSGRVRVLFALSTFKLDSDFHSNWLLQLPKMPSTFIINLFGEKVFDFVHARSVSNAFSNFPISIVNVVIPLLLLLPVVVVAL